MVPRYGWQASGWILPEGLFYFRRCVRLLMTHATEHCTLECLLNKCGSSYNSNRRTSTTGFCNLNFQTIFVIPHRSECTIGTSTVTCPRGGSSPFTWLQIYASRVYLPRTPQVSKPALRLHATKNGVGQMLPKMGWENQIRLKQAVFTRGSARNRRYIKHWYIAHNSRNFCLPSWNTGVNFILLS